MKNVNVMTDEIEESELPVSGAVRVVRRQGYGTVADLDDEAAADIGELQRISAYEMYGPLIDLPGRGRRLGHVVLDSNGEVDCGSGTSEIVIARFDTAHQAVTSVTMHVCDPPSAALPNHTFVLGTYWAVYAATAAATRPIAVALGGHVRRAC